MGSEAWSSPAIHTSRRKLTSSAYWEKDDNFCWSYKLQDCCSNNSYFCSKEIFTASCVFHSPVLLVFASNRKCRCQKTSKHISHLISHCFLQRWKFRLADSQYPNVFHKESRNINPMHTHRNPGNTFKSHLAYINLLLSSQFFVISDDVW